MAANQLLQTLSRHGVTTSVRLNPAQIQLLTEAADSVCKITISKDGNNQSWVGTGFHFGGGWVMTNYHVIVDEDDAEETFYVSKASFAFPGMAPIAGKKRSFITTHFDNWNEDSDGQSPRKDLALIHVPEVGHRKGLYDYVGDVREGHPAQGDEVWLIHYGHGSGSEQFSHGNVIKVVTQSRGDEWKCYYENDAYCPGGSSGGPLLWFNSNGQLVLCGVNYMGTETNSHGDALLFRRRHWIHDTVRFASDLCGILPIYKNLAAALSEGEIRNDTIEAYRNTLTKLDAEAVKRHLLVFFNENLQDVHDLNLKNFSAAY